MYPNTPDRLVLKTDVDGVLTDIEKTFFNCLEELSDESLQEYEECEGLELADRVCGTTNLAYKERRDLLVPREDGISVKIDDIRKALEYKTGKRIEIVISTSREGINREELIESLGSMGITNYDDVKIEHDKWRDCDILVEDNPHQIKKFLEDGDGNKAYHVKNDCSEMVYGDRQDIYQTGRCDEIYSFSDIVEDIYSKSSLTEDTVEEVPAKA